MDALLVLEALGKSIATLAEKAIGPGLGALFGALSAFKLERAREHRARSRDRSGAIKRVTFGLSLIRESLTTLQTRYLDPMKDDSARWRKLSALASAPNSLVLDLDSLTFLIDLGKQALLEDAYHCQSGYEVVLTALQERRKAQERLWDSLNSIRREHPSVKDPKELDDLVGPAITGPLESLTDALYQSVGEFLTLVKKTEAAMAALQTQDLGTEFHDD